MSIDRITARQRGKVAWLDAPVPPEARAAFEAREHVVETCTASQLQDAAYLSGLGAVVLSPAPSDQKALRTNLAEHAKRLLAYDCRIIVYATLGDFTKRGLISTIGRMELPTAGLKSDTDKETFAWFQNPEGDPPLPHVRFYRADPTQWGSIANFIASHPAGRAPDQNVTIAPLDGLNEYDQLLLRRAFAKCSEVHLFSMIEGRSGAQVYRAQVRMDAAVHGGWSQPYFVKLDKRKAIEDEYVNYEDKADPYVPFHLGPNLVPERCCLDANHGILVGDYVEESESLKECASAGRAAQAIGCLFDRTLRGWYRNYEVLDRPFLEQCSPIPDDYPAEVRAKATEIGATLEPAKFGDYLRSCTDSQWLKGPVHGDLHSTNVRVRGTEAILIDYGSHRIDLILRDIARLEVSLLIDAFSGKPYEKQVGDANFNGRAWLDEVIKLYQVNPTGNDLKHHEDPKSHAYWFHTCVRQIRLHAKQYERGSHQYAAALAYELLKKASRDDHAERFELYRRAAAYYLAEQLVKAVFPAAAVAA